MLRRLSPSIRVSGRYSFNTTRTFDERLDEEEQATIDRVFPQVRLSAFSGAVARDTRDNVIDPSRGNFLSAEGTLAARSLGGQVGFLKTYLQGLWFRQLTSRRPVVLATRGAIGLADGFPREGQAVDDSGAPIPGETVAHRGPPGERALLRRRRHDHPRLRARHRRHARDDQRQMDSREAAMPC